MHTGTQTTHSYCTHAVHCQVNLEHLQNRSLHKLHTTVPTCTYIIQTVISCKCIPTRALRCCLFTCLSMQILTTLPSKQPASKSSSHRGVCHGVVCRMLRVATLFNELMQVITPAQQATQLLHASVAVALVENISGVAFPKIEAAASQPMVPSSLGHLWVSFTNLFSVYQHSWHVLLDLICMIEKRAKIIMDGTAILQTFLQIHRGDRRHFAGKTHVVPCEFNECAKKQETACLPL